MDSVPFRAPRPQTSGPLHPQIGVIGLVPQPWSSMWQPRHHVMAALARYFHVVWMEPATEWREVPQRFLPARRPAPAERPDSAGFSVYTPPPWLPKLYNPEFLARWCHHARLGAARRMLLRRGCRRIVLYLWRPELGAALDSVPHDASFYHIDDEYSFSDEEVPVTERERQLIAAVDHVFIHSPALLRKKGSINPCTSFIPNGVDYGVFSRPAPEPEDMAGLARPRIGYIGHLKKHLDWELLDGLAERHPEWSFVYVGGAEPHPELQAYLARLARLSNVHFLGPKTTREIAMYPQHFDVCMMPYRHMAYTRYIYPLKLHEYLASGQPVVGTRIRSLLDFDDVVALADTLDEWSAALVGSLHPSARSKDRREARREVARQHGWDVLSRRIAETILSHLREQAVGESALCAG